MANVPPDTAYQYSQSAVFADGESYTFFNTNVHGRWETSGSGSEANKRTISKSVGRVIVGYERTESYIRKKIPDGREGYSRGWGQTVTYWDDAFGGGIAGLKVTQTSSSSGVAATEYYPPNRVSYTNQTTSSSTYLRYKRQTQTGTSSGLIYSTTVRGGSTTITTRSTSVEAIRLTYTPVTESYFITTTAGTGDYAVETIGNSVRGLEEVTLGIADHGDFSFSFSSASGVNHATYLTPGNTYTLTSYTGALSLATNTTGGSDYGPLYTSSYEEWYYAGYDPEYGDMYSNRTVTYEANGHTTNYSYFTATLSVETTNFTRKQVISRFQLPWKDYFTTTFLTVNSFSYSSGSSASVETYFRYPFYTTSEAIVNIRGETIGGETWNLKNSIYLSDNPFTKVFNGIGRLSVYSPMIGLDDANDPDLVFQTKTSVAAVLSLVGNEFEVPILSSNEGGYFGINSPMHYPSWSGATSNTTFKVSRIGDDLSSSWSCSNGTSVESYSGICKIVTSESCPLKILGEAIDTMTIIKNKAVQSPHLIIGGAGAPHQSQTVFFPAGVFLIFENTRSYFTTFETENFKTYTNSEISAVYPIRTFIGAGQGGGLLVDEGMP